ncbi:hypothetical protein GCM10010909_16330 [Acidocella aquatica]|uniref:Tyr recombinase domain-containing protein n=1 Tax=Acidocella aquatica TaxID=1922313 RepID=A0ABQ6A5L5_9PROT|nr:hypothetical protein [Acidocella aquatica]GLR66953.1 hypothetical protein GCM10010909_16330 [Acidocella aquatica]
MAKKPPSETMVLRVSDWPPHDKALWDNGTTPASGLRRRRRHAETLRPKSIELAWKGYGRFLAVLAAQGPLNPELNPGDRVTYDTVATFFDALRAENNKDNTIKARLFHLRTALRIMVPAQEFDWLMRPDGCALDTLFPAEPKEKPFIPSAVELFQWGMRLMHAPEPETWPSSSKESLQFCRDFRNGLIITLLASRAPRVGALAQMRLGKNLYRQNGEFWVRLQSAIVKNKREIEYSLPPELTAFFDRYLAEIRPRLLDPARTDAVWGNGDGGAFTDRSIETMVFRASLREFSHSFGPHIARDAFASTLAEADPSNPGLAAVVLGITEGVVAAHYRRAHQADAARKLQANLRDERERTRHIAERAFGRRSG